MNNAMIASVTNPSEDRFHEDGDWLARQFFSPTDLQMSPEEYAARHAHRWGCFSLHRHPYQDPILGAWVQRLGEILGTDGEVEHCRVRFLTPEERADVRRQEAEGF
jgi:hypothetical protein